MSRSPFLIVLGIAQDGGVPQLGMKSHAGWKDPAFERLATALALVDPGGPDGSRRFLFEATPDMRKQVNRMDEIWPVDSRPGIDGIFLTHAHMGHYVGLMFLGHESCGARSVPVYAMPRMTEFLSTNGPWSQLVKYENISLQTLREGQDVVLNGKLKITPLLVPHRQEFSEVVCFRIQGPSKTALFVPDIDSWEEWDRQGTTLESILAQVDVAFLDGTFFDDGELPGRDMSKVPHPLIASTMARLASLPDRERSKVRFIHLNATNPALWSESKARAEITAAGFAVAEEMDHFEL